MKELNVYLIDNETREFIKKQMRKSDNYITKEELEKLKLTPQKVNVSI